jgi:hypothetical protein
LGAILRYNLFVAKEKYLLKKPKKAAGVLSRSFTHETVVFNPANWDIFLLNNTASFVWTRVFLPGREAKGVMERFSRGVKQRTFF